jgi:hypothetical protein
MPRYASRPGYRRALTAYHLGALSGTRWYRCLGSTEWYRQQRRIIGMKYQFHAWPTHSQNTVHASDVRPLDQAEPDPVPLVLCTWCGRATCAVSMCRRARITRPAHANPRLRLMHSRMRPVLLTRFGVYIGLCPRPRTAFALRCGTLHYLAARRAMAAQCRAMGMQRLTAGVFYDSLADVLYAQATAPAGHEWDWGM